MIKDISNKHFLVTGVTSGIGKGVALELLSMGNYVLGIGRDFSKIKSEKSFVKNKYFTFIELDLVDIENIESSLSNYVLNNFKFDGLVHCAGRDEVTPIRMSKSNVIEPLFHLNVYSAIEFLRLFSQKKYSNNDSSLVYLSSVMGELGQPGKVGYCSTKSAILGMVRAASLELAKRNININAVSPGMVETPMMEKLFSNMSEENIDKIVNMHPLGIGKVSDIVPIILFLLSENGRWITGQNFKIDGGYSIH